MEEHSSTLAPFPSNAESATDIRAAWDDACAVYPVEALRGSARVRV